MSAVTRKSFIIGLGATFAMREVAFAEAAANGALPDFYKRHLVDVAGRVVCNAGKGARNGFIFFTDAHISANYSRSGFLIAELVKRTGLDRVICGGDFMPAYCGNVPPGPYVQRLYEKMCSHWRNPIESAGGRLFTAKGNHDLRVWDGPAKSDGFVYASARTRELLMSTKESSSAVVNCDEKNREGDTPHGTRVLQAFPRFQPFE